ncbi:MAG: HD-GYP domain-containing protein [Clostridia bacterium]|nr:HD-GYP domain-containing protein [Clostridia bacterium]
MRIGNVANTSTNENVAVDNSSYKILAVDDESGIVDTLSIWLKRSGYSFFGETDPMKAIERIKNEHFDLLLLDFIMTPYHGDQVVEEIRKFNKELYIILLTGHKDLAPPLETIKRLDIQGYCEKSDKPDQLLLLIESGIKSISQMREIKKINAELSETNEKLEQAYMESIQTVRYTVEAKDSYTRGHSDRVSAYSVLIGEKLGLPEEDIKKLRVGGLFHDVGKIGVPDSILQKNAKLTDDEYSEIKNHPTIGAHILSTASIFQDIVPIVKHHHERFDGRGYPGQLAGDKIPYLARIAAVADTFDAMTSRRSYRNALEIQYVIDEIDRCKGTQFDPKIADVFLDILNNEFDVIKDIQEKYNTEVAETLI